MAKRPQQEEFDRDILDIIPERYDADEYSEEARSGSRLRTIITVVVALVAVGGIVAAGWRFMSGRHLGPVGSSQVIKADDRAVKVRPDDRGGMQVPNQDKLVYGRMENEGGAAPPKTEQLLAPPEEPNPMPKPSPAAAVPPPKPADAAPPPEEPPPIAKPQPVHIQPVPANEPPPKMADPTPVKARPEPPPPAPAPAPAPVVAAPAPAPTAPAVKAVAADSSGGYLVQLGAVRSADAADKEWSRIAKANAELLSGLKSDIVQVDIPNKGTFWRIRAGTVTEQGGRQLCLQLAARNQGCILVRK